MAAGVVSVPIPNDTYKLGFIGAGKMAESIARGVVKSGVLPASRIRTAHLGSSRRAAFESFGVKVFERNVEVVEDCDVIIFSVKPQIVKEVVLQLKPLFSEKLLVSVAAGVKLKDLQEWAGHSRFIRVVPNTPAAVGEAASAMSLGGTATEEDGELIARVFGAIGKIWKTDEKLFDAITGLSGSGPAYIYLAIEALADGGVAAGLPRELALGLASQTGNLVLTEVLKGHEFYTVWFDSGKSVSTLKIERGGLGRNITFSLKNHVLGAASMVSKGGKHPGQLKDDVASPGGTTIAGIHELEKGGFRGILMNAVVAATKRSQEFSKI